MQPPDSSARHFLELLGSWVKDQGAQLDGKGKFRGEW